MSIDPSESPLSFSAENGFVIVEGPHGVILTLTHKAAIDSIDGLIQASTAAHRQAKDLPALD